MQYDPTTDHRIKNPNMSNRINWLHTTLKIKKQLPKDWHQKILTFPHFDIRISRLLEDNATPSDREAHIDLADWLLKYFEDTQQ